MVRGDNTQILVIPQVAAVAALAALAQVERPHTADQA
jgi:hypothetical protein